MTYRRVPRENASALQSLADERQMSSTPAERRFERILNSLNGGVLRGKFTREWACGKHWIVDFFFPEIRLAIEIDGGYHRTPEQLFRDLEREIEIEKFDVVLVRFTNEEVFGDRDALVAKLRDAWRTALRASRKRASTHMKKASAPTPAPAPVLEVTKSEFYKSTMRPPKAYRGGWTSLAQGGQRMGDQLPKRYVDEGFGGSRDANRQMRKEQWLDMRKRTRGK